VGARSSCSSFEDSDKPGLVVEELYSLIRVNILEAWEITRILVNTASSDEALAHVAAGPLEDLLKSQSIRKRQLEGSSVAVRRGYGM
jgi:hypothetical protein